MHATSRNFIPNARKALHDPTLQKALLNMKAGFQLRRADTIAKLPEWDDLRDAGKAIKDHTLANLDLYLEAFAAKVEERGGHVHWARSSGEACQIIVDLCKAAGARTVTKGKSMVTEEIGLNAAIEAAGLQPIETDLGEYIIQLRHEPPSHIIAPAIHLTKDEVADTFRAHHQDLPADRPLVEHRALLDEARAKLRQKFIAADVGITGANFLIAETGSTVIVTNEGNGDLTQSLPRTHIVVASLEKVVPTLEDATSILRLLARSATGQEFSAYTTFSTGPRRPEDLDGPEHFHVVLVDNGRSAMLGTGFQDMLRCIRCSACMNHCPVYQAVGGHAYGWVYPGPMGAVLTPTLIGVEEAGHLPNASTFCGKCESVCPMHIPLPKMMRHWRERQYDRGLTPHAARYGLKLWAFFAKRPSLYAAATKLLAAGLAKLAGRAGRLRDLPFARGWTAVRDLPAPQGKTFQQLYAERQRTGRGG